ncbi:hypothetical protein PGR6_29140 [Pseudomonas sp. GR 6-02]|jgi:hypothetical protein|nr:hypothetical protein PGR6_29140 [Pseudomonas sp. GR 6-02]
MFMEKGRRLQVRHIWASFSRLSDLLGSSGLRELSFEQLSLAD